jgi:hypothetical protein
LGLGVVPEPLTDISFSFLQFKNNAKRMIINDKSLTFNILTYLKFVR